MNARMLVGSFAVVASATCWGQFSELFSSQYAQAGGNAITADGASASDFQQNDNLPFGYSFVNSGAIAQLGGNTGQGIARQGSVVESYRLEATHFGDAAANASGFEGDTAGGGAFCDWSHWFTVEQDTPYVAWGRIGVENGYTFFRLYTNDDFDIPVIDESPGAAFLYTGTISAQKGNQVQYQSLSSVSAWWERSFRAGAFSGNVYFKINTVLADELRPQMGTILQGDINSLAITEDNDRLVILAKELPWNRVNQYILTAMPKVKMQKLVADVVSHGSATHPNYMIRAFNWKTQQWVVAYQGPTPLVPTRRVVEFPGYVSDYISPNPGLYNGKVIGAVSWMGQFGTQPDWTVSVDMFQMSYRAAPLFAGGKN